VRKSAGKNNGSGQLIYLPVQRALAVDGSRFTVYSAGRCQTRLYCGRPFFRRILSSLHRKPERRKRNAHHSAFRQSLHCLIAEHCGGMHLSCRLCAALWIYQCAGNKGFSVAGNRGQPLCGLNLADFHSLARILTHRPHPTCAPLPKSDSGSLIPWSEMRVLLRLNATAQISSSCTAKRLG
jgi:hypothetical protein